jgi:hypothetical protein
LSGPVADQAALHGLLNKNPRSRLRNCVGDAAELNLNKTTKSIERTKK